MNSSSSTFEMLLPLVTIIVILIILFAVFRLLWGPRASSWLLHSSGEEKIGLSKNKLYNANGYIVQSGSDILLGSTGSFKRFESVDRQSGYDGELVAAMPMLTPPWATDESIPPQPLRPAPLPLATKLKSNKNTSNNTAVVNKQQSLETKALSSAPMIKALPRPIPRKQLSAPAAASNFHIPLIQPPKNEKTVKDAQTNPFLNGLINFESIKSNFFSTTVFETTTSASAFATECKIEDERASKSAATIASKNPFKNSSVDSNFFDFNPTAIKSIMEEAPDEAGYEGDNDEIEDPLKQLEARIQKLEASNKQRRRSESQSPPRYSPKMLNKSSNSSTPTSTTDGGSELNLNVNEKFVDSSLNLDGVVALVGGGSGTNGYRKHLRNRSYSENEACELDMVCEQEVPITISSTNPFQTTPTMSTTTTNSKRPLLKTPSETYLEQYSSNYMKPNVTSSSVVVVNNKTIQLCKHPSLTKILQSTPQTLNFDSSSNVGNDTALKRTISSESISSDSSVVMSTLEKPAPPVTGNLCIALQYDKHATEEGIELLVSIVEARDLLIPTDADPDCVDTFVRVYLLPDESEAMQTKIFRNSNNPSYQESFLFFIAKQYIKRSLWFHLYHTNAQCTTLIGETELKLTEFRKPITTWLQLTDSRNNCTNFGDLMFSLSYLPTAERLTVCVGKARNLKPCSDENENHSNEIQNVYVKVYLLKNDKKVSKKRTTIKRGEQNPVFNEAILFSVPPYLLNSIQVRLTVMNSHASMHDSTTSVNGNGRKSYPIGHVIVGSRTDGKGLLHWHLMLTTLRKQVAFFHPLRRSVNKNQIATVRKSTLC